MILPLGVNTISYNNKYRKPVAFSSSIGEYYLKSQYSKRLISNFTKMFRQDIEWNKLTEYIFNNFKTKNKVNILNLASSDGSEPYSLAIALKSKFGENSNKFFPIFATDRNEKIINRAKTGNIDLFEDDITRIKDFGCDFDRFFKPAKDNVPPEIKERFKNISCSTYSATEELKNLVKFDKGMISEQLHSLKDDGNTLILCRNVFPYLDIYDFYYTLDLLGEKLKKGSLVVLGSYDENLNTSNLLCKKGFESVGKNLFRKT